jgi:DNA-binding CsgD family transcriptional regulator
MRSIEMVGRGDELSQLLGAVDRAREGRVGLVLVAGEAGIGKSRLVEEMMSRLDGDAVLLVGHGVELESGELPFGVVTETLRSLVFRIGPAVVQQLVGDEEAAGLAPLVPELGDHITADRVAMVSACLRFFESLAQEHLVCWIVEDLQWADAPTRDIVGLLCRTVPSGRLLVVCTARTGEPLDTPLLGAGLESPLRELARLPNAELVALSRLAPTSVRELAHNLVGGGAVSRAAVERIVELSDGIPLLVEELAAGGRADVFTVEALTGGRLQNLGADGRRLVEAAAIGEGHLDSALVEEVLRLPPDEFDAALRDAVAAGILEESSLHGLLRFRHALVRQSVDDQIPPGLRRSWHARWAEVLEPNADRAVARPVVFAVAHHRFHAGDSEPAFDSLVTAAEVAHQTGVVSEEYTLLMRLLGLWSSVEAPARRAGASHRDVLYAAVWACYWGEGSPVMAQVIEQTLLERTDDQVERAWLQLDLAEARSGSWPHLDLTEAEIQGYVALFSTPPVDRMMVDGLRVLLGMTPIESVLWEQILERAYRGAREVGDELLQLTCQLNASQRLVMLGRPDVAAEVLDRELAKPWTLPPHLLCMSDGGLIWTLAIQGKYADADRAARRALARIEDPRPVAAVWEHVVESVVWVWRMTGRWDEAENLLASSRSYWGDELLRVDLHAEVLELLRTGRVMRPADWQALLQSDAPRQRLDDIALLEHCALLAAAEGDLDSARAHYRRIWEVREPRNATEDLFTSVLQAARMEADARTSRRHRVDEEVQATEAVDAEEHLYQVLQIASRLHSFGDLGIAWHTEVAAQRARFYREETGDLFEKAVAAWDAVGQPYDAALCRLRLAESHLNRGDRVAAAKQLEAVTRAATSLGAEPLAAQTNALADRAGIRRAGGPSGQIRILTPREHEVLILLADGRSNRQIAANLYMSPKTVSVHVSRILTKLGATNRTEAVAIARREALIEL